MAVAIFRTNWSSFKEELWTKKQDLKGKEYMYHVWNFSSNIMVYSLTNHVFRLQEDLIKPAKYIELLVYSRTKQTYNDAYLLYKTFTRYAALKLCCKII